MAKLRRKRGGLSGLFLATAAATASLDQGDEMDIHHAGLDSFPGSEDEGVDFSFLESNGSAGLHGSEFLKGFRGGGLTGEFLTSEIDVELARIFSQGRLVD